VSGLELKMWTRDRGWIVFFLGVLTPQVAVFQLKKLEPANLAKKNN
jgi:hypothetical protein